MSKYNKFKAIITSYCNKKYNQNIEITRNEIFNEDPMFLLHFVTANIDTPFYVKTIQFQNLKTKQIVHTLNF